MEPEVSSSVSAHCWRWRSKRCLLLISADTGFVCKLSTTSPAVGRAVKCCHLDGNSPSGYKASRKHQNKLVLTYSLLLKGTYLILCPGWGCGCRARGPLEERGVRERLGVRRGWGCCPRSALQNPLTFKCLLDALEPDPGRLRGGVRQDTEHPSASAGRAHPLSLPCKLGVVELSRGWICQVLLSGSQPKLHPCPSP